MLYTTVPPVCSTVCVCLLAVTCHAECYTQLFLLCIVQCVFTTFSRACIHTKCCTQLYHLCMVLCLCSLLSVEPVYIQNAVHNCTTCVCCTQLYHLCMVLCLCSVLSVEPVYIQNAVHNCTTNTRKATLGTEKHHCSNWRLMYGTFSSFRYEADLATAFLNNKIGSVCVT